MPLLSLGSQGGFCLRLPSNTLFKNMTSIEGTRRAGFIRGQIPPPDKDLVEQPSLFYPHIKGYTMVCPLMFPTATLSRLELAPKFSQLGLIAHAMDSWEMFVWRPRNLFGKSERHPDHIISNGLSR